MESFSHIGTMAQRVKVGDRWFRKMISSQEIDLAVSRVAEQISRDYAHSTPIFVGVLSGSYIFMSDLLRKLTIDSEVDFIKISSYEGTQSLGTITEQILLSCNIEGRDVIIVEDIIDTGTTIKYLLEGLLHLGARSIAVCTLFFKPEKFRYDYKIDYVALSIGNEFIVGYGLDYNQLGRNLREVYVIDE